jgi:chromosome segregation ATPase
MEKKNKELSDSRISKNRRVIQIEAEIEKLIKPIHPSLFEQMEEEKAKIDYIIKDLEQVIKHFKTTIVELEMEKETATKKLDTLKAEIENYKSEISKFNVGFNPDTIKSSLERTKTKIKSLSEQTETNKLKKRDIEADIEKHQSDINKYEETLKIEKEKKSRLFFEVEELVLKRKAKEREIYFKEFTVDSTKAEIIEPEENVNDFEIIKHFVLEERELKHDLDMRMRRMEDLIFEPNESSTHGGFHPTPVKKLTRHITDKSTETHSTPIEKNTFKTPFIQGGHSVSQNLGSTDSPFVPHDLKRKNLDTSGASNPKSAKN